MDFRTIKEEYNSIYKSAPQNLSEETEVVEQEIVEDYSADFEELTEEVIDEIIVDMLDEGYTGEEILDGFDDLLEAMTPKQKEMRAKFKEKQKMMLLLVRVREQTFVPRQLLMLRQR